MRTHNKCSTSSSYVRKLKKGLTSYSKFDKNFIANRCKRSALSRRAAFHIYEAMLKESRNLGIFPTFKKYYSSSSDSRDISEDIGVDIKIASILNKLCYRLKNSSHK